jgi:hypothetical protein
VSLVLQMADTADQDSDKQKTYDMARVEFAHLASILFVDSDEFLFCPAASTARSNASSNNAAPAGNSGEGDPLESQGKRQRALLDHLQGQGAQEIRLSRVAFSGKCAFPSASPTATSAETTGDFTECTHQCMLDHYTAARSQSSNRSVDTALTSRSLMRQLFSCWSGAALHNNPGKSVDVRSSCPFLWVHWACFFMNDILHRPTDKPNRFR